MKTENKITTYLLYFFIGFSLIIGSFGSFWLYLKKYLANDPTLNGKIEELLADIYVSPDKYGMYIFIIACICMFLLWILGFIVYKVIFKIAKIPNSHVKDGELLLAIGSAHIISFLVGYLLIGTIDSFLVTVVTNVIEMVVVYIALFDKIKNKLGICILCRGVLLALNVILTLVSI